MKLRNLIFLAFFAIPLGAIAFTQEPNIQHNWVELEAGITYQQYQLTDPVPVNIFVARMSRVIPEVAIESSIAQGRLSGGVETVSDMADQYDQALNNWPITTDPISQTWGSRNNVVVAINGFFFGPSKEEPGIPWSGQIYSGWYSKRYSNSETNTAGSGFAWRHDRSTFIGGCVSHPIDKQFIDFDEGRVDEFQLIDGVNRPREENELVLYTSQFDRDTGTNGGSNSLEVLVEMIKPTMLTSSDQIPVGIVRQMLEGSGSTPIPFDHIVLSAHGSSADKLRSNIHVDDSIGINQKIKHFLQDDCTTLSSEEWTGVYASIAGSYNFLRNGEIFPFTDESDAIYRQPRTAIAYNEDFIFFIVADGRNPSISEGMTVAGMGEFVKNTLNATDAIMQDGGGSSTMVVNGEVVNNTFCNNVFCTDKVFLPLVVNNYDTNTLTSKEVSSIPQLYEIDTKTQVLERLVANGMMMVVIKPFEKSTQPYDPMDPITIISQSDLYLGPGTNYAIMEEAQGDYWISKPLNNLGGVYAKGNFWWKITNQPPNVTLDTTVTEGWVIETSIDQVLKFRNSNEFKSR